MNDPLVIPRGAVLRIEEGAGMVLSIHFGAVWLTQEGDSKDYYLSDGQSFRLDREGVALLTVMRRACISTHAAKPERMLVLRAASGAIQQVYAGGKLDFVRRWLARLGLARPITVA